MWHKQSFTQFWSQSDAYSRRSSLKLTYIHHPLVVCTHQICCAVAVPIALSQDRLLHGHNRLVNWTPCSRMRESKLKKHMQYIFYFVSAIYERILTNHSYVQAHIFCACFSRILKKIWLPQFLDVHPVYIMCLLCDHISILCEPISRRIYSLI